VAADGDRRFSLKCQAFMAQALLASGGGDPGGERVGLLDLRSTPAAAIGRRALGSRPLATQVRVEISPSLSRAGTGPTFDAMQAVAERIVCSSQVSSASDLCCAGRWPAVRWEAWLHRVVLCRIVEHQRGQLLFRHGEISGCRLLGLSSHRRAPTERSAKSTGRLVAISARFNRRSAGNQVDLGQPQVIELR
jgi:hypothetical protein